MEEKRLWELPGEESGANTACTSMALRCVALMPIQSSREADASLDAERRACWYILAGAPPPITNTSLSSACAAR